MNTIGQTLAIQRACAELAAGGVVACATEAVWGFSADPENPDAVQRILQLKQRSVRKGLILVTASAEQAQPYLAQKALTESVLASWPGPVTWLLPAAESTPYWVTGGSDLVAVRVTAHPGMAALCQAWGGALVSTSANRAGRPAIREKNRLRQQFGRSLASILPMPLGQASTPSEIRHGLSGEVVRAAA